jgi:hypothetical protein
MENAGRRGSIANCWSRRMGQHTKLGVEAEKGFRGTLFDPELVDPNLEINFVNNAGAIVIIMAISTQAF